MEEEDLILEIEGRYILHWNYRGFAQIPQELRQGEKVKEIYLKWNNLQKMPRWIGELKNLSNLYLQYNQLKTLPEELCELSQLDILDVTHNRIQFLPSRIGCLSSLTRLLVADNALKCLPKEFKMLQSLEVLDLRSNDLAYLPECVLECHALQELFLDNNKLSCLPDNVVYLPHLATLSVCGNNILYLPFQPFLSNPEIWFENNPNLSFISIWLGKQIASNSKDKFDEDRSWNLKGAKGCFFPIICPKPLKKRAPYVRNEATGQEVSLILPSSLRSFSSGPSCQPTVPPLLELTLRKAYSMGYHHKIHMTNHERGERTIFSTNRKDLNFHYYLCLPSFLQKQFKVGPVTLCYNPKCQKPVFTYGVIWVILKDCNIVTDSDPHKLYVMLLVIFCSVTCSEHYAQWERSNSNTITLESLKLNWFKQS